MYKKMSMDYMINFVYDDSQQSVKEIVDFAEKEIIKENYKETLEQNMSKLLEELSEESSDDITNSSLFFQDKGIIYGLIGNPYIYGKIKLFH